MKPNLCHATEIRSPAQKSLNLEVEQVHKRATRWILSLMTGQMSNGGRLLALPYDREIKDLIFFYTWTASTTLFNVDIKYYVTFNSHPRRRCGQPIELYWLLLLLSRPVRLALFKLYTLFVL